MRVRVDLDLCRGHGRCYALCPEIFHEDEEGYCVLPSADVPAEQREAARRAAYNCPEVAITLEEAG
jgi:ferredoxin